MRWKWLGLALIAVAGGYLVWSGGGLGKKQDLTREMKAEEILAAAREKAGGLKSYRLRAKIGMGEQIKINLTNRVKRNEGITQLVDLEWSSPQGSGLTSIFMRDRDIYILHPLENKWFIPEERPEVKPIASMFVKQLDIADPVTAVKQTDLRQKAVTVLPDEEVDGQVTKVIEISKPGAAEEFTRILPPQLIGAKPVEVKQTYWIGKEDLLIYKYSFRAKLSVLGIAGPTLEITTKVTDHNKTDFQIPNKLRPRLEQKS